MTRNTAGLPIPPNKRNAFLYWKNLIGQHGGAEVSAAASCCEAALVCYLNAQRFHALTVSVWLSQVNWRLEIAE